ncbi:MAG: TonB-dependent siderophore receptor, partial [Gammaproteobacteria bacterium]
NKALDASSAMRDTVASVVFPLFYQLPSHHSPVPGGFFTASQIKNAVENVSGVRTIGLSGYADGFVIRGFNDGGIFRNGLELNFTTFDTVTAERIEVLKGPAAVLYGRSEPGGLINLVTKKPLDAPYYSAEQQFGSYDFFRTQWDATGPLNQDRSLLYRFTGAYQNNDSFRDFHDLERVVLYPSLTWRPTSATEATVDLEYIHDDTHVDYFGIPAIGTRSAPVPISRSFQDPNDPSETFDRICLGFNLSHRFNDSWTLTNRFLAAFHDHLEPDFNPAGVRADNRTLDRVATRYGLNDDGYQTNLDLTGKFTLWDTHHEALVGFDYFRFSRQLLFLFQDFENPDPALAIDIFNPRYGIDPAVFNIENLPLASLSQDEQEQYGVYFQDHITLWDKLHILAGGRYDWATLARGDSDISIDAIRLDDERKDEEFSPRVGLLYQPWPWLGVYGNWVQSFGTNNGRSATGEPHAPQTGEQFEAGLKTQLFESGVTATLAYFHLTKGNLLTPDLFTAEDPFDTVPIGEARSQGVELDIAGRVTDTLSLIGSYAYTDAEITEDSRGLQGNLLANAPLHSGSLWLKYDVNGYSADGLSFGVGVFANGQQEGDNENTFQLPGYARLDALAAYRWKIGPSRLIAQLNIRNLLDKEYYENADRNSNNAPRNAIWPGAPLTVLGSIRVEF